MIYKLIDSAEFAMENKLMYFGHVAGFVLDDRNNTLFTASFRRDPRKPLPKAQAANMQGAILPQGVAADMPEGAPLHYRQLFMALLLNDCGGRARAVSAGDGGARERALLQELRPVCGTRTTVGRRADFQICQSC